MKRIVQISAISVSSFLLMAHIKNVEASRQKEYKKLPEKEKYEHEVMEFALRNNAFYRSGDALLQHMAVAFYKNDPELATRARFWYERSKQTESSSVDAAKVEPSLK